MESERTPSAPRGDDERTERDDDLVALEGLEAEFAELDSELGRVERSRGDGTDATDR